MAKSFVLEGRAAVRPMIYAYTLKAEGYGDLLKVGYTERDVETRVREQVANIKLPFAIHKIVLRESAMRRDGSTFDDHAVHRLLKRHGVRRPDGEWFRCGVDEVRAAIVAVRNRQDYQAARTWDFAMRPEQAEAVRLTADYFRRKAKEEPGTKPRFLWNAKMRFGKAFAAYELAKEMGFKRILILTFKPAVVSAWEEDCLTHVDFAGWQFIRRPDDPGEPDLEEQYMKTDGRRPIVCFGSFQDFLGVNEFGGIKEHHKWVREEQWDLVIFDEYHYGAWREKAKDLFGKEDEEGEVEAAESAEGAKPTGAERLSEDDLPIQAARYLYLSGTPFRSLASGEFIEEQVYGWTYADEQRAKEGWQGPGANPYAALPQMVMLTYRLPEAIRKVAEAGEFNEFDLNVFFSTTKGADGVPRFVWEENVQQWLDYLRGRYLPTEVEGLKTREPVALPFAKGALADALQHSVWFLPNVAACEAMDALLHGAAVGRYPDVTQPEEPGDLFPGGVPRAESVDDARRAGAGGHHQAPVLCAGLRAEPGLASGGGIQRQAEHQRGRAANGRGAGGRIHPLPADSLFRRREAEPHRCDSGVGACLHRRCGDAPGAAVAERPARERGQRDAQARAGEPGGVGRAGEDHRRPKPQPRYHRGHHQPHG